MGVFGLKGALVFGSTKMLTGGGRQVGLSLPMALDLPQAFCVTVPQQNEQTSMPPRVG